MRVALPNIDEINEKNVVNAVKQLILALEQESDLYGHHDTKLTEEVHLLREETREGFSNLKGQFKEEIGMLRSDMNARMDKQQAEIGRLRSDMNEEIGGLRKEMKTEIGGLRKEMNEEIGGLRSDINTRMGKQDEKFDQMVDLLKMVVENTKK